MFKKLRNKFLILNMSIITIVMVAAFVVVYLLTYNSIRTENRNKLESLGISVGREISSVDFRNEGGAASGGKVTVHNFYPIDSICFTIKVDENGTILSVNSYLDMPTESYVKAAESAWNQKEDYTSVKLEGKEWMYLINQTESVQMLGIDSGKFDVIGISAMYQITFLDVTESSRALVSLLYTFLVVGFIMLFVIGLISMYFAERTIKPIAEAWKKQKQFVADASHELKTPLTIIKSNHGVLLVNQDETVRSQMKWLDYIKNGTDRISKLVNDLLILAMIDNMDLDFREVSFDISCIVREVINSMEAIASLKGIRMSSSIESNLVIDSDMEKVRQVITILMDNAIKYTDDDGWVDVSLEKSKRRVVFCATNSGKGVTKEDLPKIFDRFYRADQARTGDGGYGLGLSIAKTIADRLHGRLSVKSIPNDHTTFTFTL